MRVVFGVDLTYFLWSAAAGVILAVIYDVLRLTRRIIPTADLIINLQDILFTAAAGLAAGFIAYSKNNGNLRAYGILAMAAAFGLYRLILGDSAVRLVYCIFTAAYKAVRKIISVILIPIRFAVRPAAAAGRAVYAMISGGNHKSGTNDNNAEREPNAS